MTIIFGHSAVYGYVVLAVFVVFRLPWLLERGLDVARNWNDYRANRPDR